MVDAIRREPAIQEQRKLPRWFSPFNKPVAESPNRAVLPLALLLPGALFLCLYNLGTGAVWGSYTAVDEARHIRVAQEMWLSGKWWSPTLDGKPYFLKPPLKILLTLLPAQLLGESNFSYRVLDGLLGVGIVCFAFFLAVRLFRRPWAGFLAGVFLLANQAFLFIHGVRSAVQDTAMLFLTTVVMWFAWNLFERLESVQRVGAIGKPTERELLKYGVICGVVTAFAVLTKSAAGFYPLLPLGVFGVLTGAFGRLGRSEVKALSVFAALSLGLPALYYVPHFLFTEHAFSNAVHHELLNRFGKGMHNVDDRTFYLRLISGDQVVPGLSLLLSALFFLDRSFRTRERAWLFVLLWGIVPLGVFSLLRSRTVWYLAPCYVPFALMLGVSVECAVRKGWQHFCLFTGRPFFSRSLAVIVGCFLFASWTVLKGVHGVATNASMVVRGQPQLPIDSLVKEMLDGLRHQREEEDSPRGVLLFGHPPLARNEHVYLNMLRREIVEPRSEEEFLARWQSGKFRYAITSLPLAKKLKGEDTTYAILPPNRERQEYNQKKRLRPIVVLQRGATHSSFFLETLPKVHPRQ